MKKEERTMAKFTPEWMSAWQKKVNEDPRFKLVGRFMDCTIKFGFGKKEYVVKMDNGKLNIVDKGTPSQFALMGNEDAWSKFTEPVPPPLFNDIWALAHPLHKNVVIEGDDIVFWQNCFAMNRLFELAREV
jgi:hypothetical protein